jgi:hypothetical protein
MIQECTSRSSNLWAPEEKIEEEEAEKIKRFYRAYPMKISLPRAYHDR